MTNNQAVISSIPTIPRAYLDVAFKSRTLILEDGRAFWVEKSRIVTDIPELVAYLDQHDDFESVAA
ncbi:hypothetical protein FNU76_19200 [Chitinimonas arctica]|uniref:Uncharacterized protein n=1 Tax=Chitinimonas arctica TaxID=2594795 RepID=A0A516SJH9_9NEIS|nr:hypothetical protein [Chitinimonas arctica]QDQ28305.1 hypothetical protein FNU76_19200 [Chitinimonas arctica]